ncbi:hypothetical protein FOCC_FOCC009032 [Frankliniella occidentalis]|uniref:B9 domain-containing protein 2 n=1 Tax=Frankliniella occidentalis TaxID=133901 RepID=A0A6J1S2M5_FRAOC|nr:B9 domain-containing protein 2-like [Frankliniella occidentalis]KAE8744309.1 hypothetical protein FOCC_FOCC009032 [Frankliniella occidentalis]
MAEVHIIGQILSATGFPSHNLFCKWGIHAGAGWRVIEGLTDGQTHVDNPSWQDIAVWSHPIDVHFATKGVQGWPKIHLQVYHYDKFGRSEVYGYGFCYIPTSPGTHKVDVVTWRPIGTLAEQFRQHFLGGGAQLKTPDLVHNSTDRYRLQTETMGSVHLEISVILRNFAKFGVET